MYYFTKYFGPTTHKGSRIRVQYAGREWGERVTRWVSYDYGASCAHTAAVALVAEVPYPHVDRLTDTPDGSGYVLSVPNTP